MGLRNYSFLYCSLFFLTGCFIVSVDAQCDGEITDFRTNITILDLEGTINFGLSDRQNLSSYVMNITYSWDVHVPEGDKFDGFIYCFFDIEKNSHETFIGIDTLSSGDLQSIDPNDIIDPFFLNTSRTPFTSCPNYDGEYWLTYRNGTYTNCSYPCSDVVNISCLYDEPLACLNLKKGECLPLPRYQRNVTIPIEFGRTYSFRIFPYEGHFPFEIPDYNRIDVSLFCGHHLIEKENVSTEAAYEFCRVNQSIAGSQTASGPPANFHQKKVYYNLIEKTVTVELTWRSPHDVASDATITSYFIHSTVHPIEFPSVVAKSPEEMKIDPFYTYNLTFNGVTSDKFIELTLRAIVDRKRCIINCQMQSSEATLLLEIKAYSPCLDFCDPNANCSEMEGNDDELLANCSCFAGYKGNGISSNLSIGTGCQNFNACLDAVENFCSSDAICTDAPPPSLGVLKCTCRSNYIGDGWAKGSGCLHIAVPITFGTLGCLILIGALVSAYMFRRRLTNKRVLEATLSRFVGGKNGTHNGPIISTAFVPDRESGSAEPIFGNKYEVDRESITTHERIGRGNFGVVHKASLKTDDGIKTVAVKSLTGVYTVNYRDDFLAEIALLINLQEHENILSVKGVCTVLSVDDESKPLSPLLVMEYMPYGDLLHFLWNSRDADMRATDPIYNFTEVSLCKIARQVASGMHFLFQSKIIHGDLAARNILVGKDLKVKISDFGLANDVYRYGVIKGATERRVPFKWISPERMMGGKSPITWKSDVWSFGILLFEMVTLGTVPYSGMDPITIFYKLQSGYRIPQPESCSDFLYEIMRKCWAWNAYSRPGFDKLRDDLESFVSSRTANNSSTIHSRLPVDNYFSITDYERDVGKEEPDSQQVDDLGEIEHGSSENTTESQTANGPVVLNTLQKEIDTEEQENSSSILWHPRGGDVPVLLDLESENDMPDHFGRVA